MLAVCCFYLSKNIFVNFGLFKTWLIDSSQTSLNNGVFMLSCDFIINEEYCGGKIFLVRYDELFSSPETCMI